MFDARFAIQIARNAGNWKGDSGDEEEGGAVLTPYGLVETLSNGKGKHGPHGARDRNLAEARSTDAPVILLGTHPRPKSKRVRSHKIGMGINDFRSAHRHAPIFTLLFPIS